MKTIKTTACIGIWMDHSMAHLIEFTIPMNTKNLESKFITESQFHSLSNNEKLMHNKAKQKQAEFYKSIISVIKNYDEVVLFGPAEAKIELFNMLDADPRFDKIKMEIKQADKMTENQEHEFVKNYFSKHVHTS